MEEKILTDEQLVLLAKNGDENALDILMQRFRSVALAISRSYFLMGGDQDDLAQEAMLGLYKACLSYSENKGAKFSTFARMCMTKNVQTAVKLANSKKHSVLNQSLSSQMGDDEDDEDIELFIPSPELLPDEVIIEEEKLKEIKQEIQNKLSSFELKTLKYYLKGLTYIEIANRLNENPKKIDNALNRIKHKLSYLKK